MTPYLNLAAILLTVCLCIGCPETTTPSGEEPSGGTAETGAVTLVTDQVVEAACGECQLGLEGSGCDLAVRIDGKSYYVDGSSIDEHGDAHGSEGLCNCIRQAKVSGQVVDGRFAATSFEVLPMKDSNDSGGSAEKATQ